MEIYNWHLLDFGDSTGIAISLYNQSESFELLKRGIGKANLQRVAGNNVEEQSENGPDRHMKTEVFFDKRNRIDYFVKTSDLHLVIGGYVLVIKNFGKKGSEIKGLSLSISNQYQTTILNSRVSVEHIIIEGIKEK